MAVTVSKTVTAAGGQVAGGFPGTRAGCAPVPSNPRRRAARPLELRIVGRETTPRFWLLAGGAYALRVPEPRL